jgi:predicted KAP-like P-loop ATPase
MILEFPLPTHLQLSKEDEEELISIKKEIRFKIKEDSKKGISKKSAYFELKVSLVESLKSCCFKCK